MAKVEFYEIIIKNKEDNIIITNISLSQIIKKYLTENSDVDNFCQKGKCAVIVNEHVTNDKNDTTFDFSKLTNKVIISTLISEPSKGEDTFKEYDKKKLETTTYNNKERKSIEEIISTASEDKLINMLKKSNIDKFKIYKIILDFDLLEEELLYKFETQIMKRLHKDSIYFQITEKFKNSNHKLLSYQSSSDGLDIKYLEDYLNTHLLISEKFKIYFRKLYDADFMALLQNGELKSFMFSYGVENKDNLIDEGLFNPLYSIKNLFGDNITKVEIKAKDDEILDNYKLLDFFEKARDTGFLDTCELKKKDGGNKKIDFKDKKLNIEYTENINIKNINEASTFFDRALSKKDGIISQRLGVSHE